MTHKKPNGYYIIERMDCPKCHGDGSTAEQQDAYYASTLPQEKPKCPECGGKGQVKRETSLAEALRRLGVTE